VTGALVAGALAALLVVGACTAPLQSTSGIVLSVQGSSPGVVDGFVLRTSDGQVITFSTVKTQFDRTGFPPQHLREHQALATPVLVTYRTESGVNDVIKLEDAPFR
jgi:hypothetical protein